MMNPRFTAIVQKDGHWWIGWLKEISGVNAQECTREELMESLGKALHNILELHSEEDLKSASGHFWRRSLGISAAFMRHKLLMLALALLLTACGARDEIQQPLDDSVVQEKLAGVWLSEVEYPDGFRGSGMITNAADGTYVCRFKMRRRSNEVEITTMEGTWRVEDGFLIDTLTRHSRADGSVPGPSRARIIRFDDSKFLLEYEVEPGTYMATNQVLFQRLRK